MHSPSILEIEMAKVIATAVNVLPNTIAGSWKFDRTRKSFEASVRELAETAKELVDQNPGGGIYRKVFIRSTAENELGICFVYEPSPSEPTDNKIWMKPYKDFFKRRHGEDFKGYDIGHTIIEVTLETI